MRKKNALVALLVAMTLAPLGLGTTPAWAEVTVCDRTIDFPTGVITGGTYGNIVVPEGGYCELRATVVRGDVIALENAELHIGHGGGSTIKGDVVGDMAEIVHVHNSTVKGDIRIEGGEHADFSHPDAVVNFSTIQGNIEVARMVGGVVIGFNTVVGDISLHENEIQAAINPSNPSEQRSRLLLVRFHQEASCAGCEVKGDIHVINNKGPGFVQMNTAAAVSCHDNTPEATFIGGPNNARETLGQCS